MQTPPAGTVSLSAAIRSAERKYHPFVSSAGAHGATLTAARFGRLTLPNYAAPGPDGGLTPIIDHREVWLLTFSAANVPYTGGPPPGKTRLSNVPSFSSVAYVVVDGKTGKALDLFAVSRSSS